MWPDRVSNPGPLTYESGAQPLALGTYRVKTDTLRQQYEYIIYLDNKISPIETRAKLYQFTMFDLLYTRGIQVDYIIIFDSFIKMCNLLCPTIFEGISPLNIGDPEDMKTVNKTIFYNDCMISIRYVLTFYRQKICEMRNSSIFIYLFTYIYFYGMMMI